MSKMKFLIKVPVFLVGLPLVFTGGLLGYLLGLVFYAGVVGSRDAAALLGFGNRD